MNFYEVPPAIPPLLRARSGTGPKAKFMNVFLFRIKKITWAEKGLVVFYSASVTGFFYSGPLTQNSGAGNPIINWIMFPGDQGLGQMGCLLYTSEAADE